MQAWMEGCCSGGFTLLSQNLTVMKKSTQQAQFLDLHMIEQKTYDEISTLLGIPRATLSEWYEELLPERRYIAWVRTLWNKKKPTPHFREFYDWYIAHRDQCNYCGITEAEIKQLLDAGKLYTKRIGTHGRKLELDRINPNGSDLLNNLVVACYWCNNAKTDTFSHEEFLEVGKAIRKIWEARLRG